MKQRLLYILISLLLITGLLTGCKGGNSSSANQTTTQKEAVTTKAVTTSAAETDSKKSTETIIENTTAKETVEEKTTAEQITEEETTVEETTIEENIAVTTEAENIDTVSEDGEYSSKDEVAEYLHLYGHLPSNYITKKEAENLGWVSSKGNLWDVAPGKSIGGDKFGNYEGLLPSKKKRQYYECDIDYEGGKRNAKRIIFSNDGLVYYTEDHYKSFELLYEGN